jgi:hypothetical protein
VKYIKEDMRDQFYKQIPMPISKIEKDPLYAKILENIYNRTDLKAASDSPEKCQKMINRLRSYHYNNFLHDLDGPLHLRFGLRRMVGIPMY